MSIHLFKYYAYKFCTPGVKWYIILRESVNSIRFDVLNQLTYYQEHIKGNPDYEFFGIYADEGISGTNTKKREQFNQMIADCKAGKIDMIMTKSISRFARNTLDCLQYVRLLKDLGIEIFFEKENINTLDSKGGILLTLLSSLAQEESNNLSQVTTWGIRRRFEQGKMTINEKKFLGYDKDEEGNLIINKLQAKIVKRIYQEYLNGKGPTRIARELEENQVKGVTGTTKWYTTTINKILRNEKYKGDALLQKTYTTDFLNKTRVKNEGQAPQYYVEESHPAIIQPDMWDAVQLEIERRKKYIEQYKLQKYDYGVVDMAFAGRVICEECGRAYQRKTWHSNSKPVRVWQCGSKYQEKGKIGCVNSHIYVQKLDEIFISAFNTLMENKETFLIKWKEELKEADVLKAYRLRQFIELIAEAATIEEVDKELVFKVLDKITVVDRGQVIVKFLDGTELECEIES